MKFSGFPKFVLLLLPAAIFALALTGCGGSTTLGLTQGNWAFAATSTSPVLRNVAESSFVIGGNLTQNGNNLTGEMYITQSGCIPQQFVSFTGTVKDKNVTLTSESFGGNVITVAVSGTKDSLTGNYTVTGECSDSGTISASAVPSISGTWNGTITNVAARGSGVAEATVSVALTQAATASEDGTFALSGTLTYSNSVCAVTGTISNGYLAGNFITMSGSTDDGDGEFFYENVTLDSVTAPHSMTGTYQDCGPEAQTVTLTKQ